jgi:hypothetical protein
MVGMLRDRAVAVVGVLGAVAEGIEPEADKPMR